MTDIAAGTEARAEMAPYRDPRPLAKFITALVYVQILLAILNILSSLSQFGLLTAFRSHVYTDTATITALAEENDARERLLGIAWLAFYIFTTVFVLKWIYRLNRNARSFGFRPLKTTPGWAVGWFFIPFLNLYKPYGVMKEIWAASQVPEAGEKKGAAVIGWWWALFLIANIAGRFSFLVTKHAQTLDELLGATLIEVLATLLMIPLDFVFLMLLWRIVRKQRTAAAFVERNR
jgi:Domain of unknown function (DUF4328)